MFPATNHPSAPPAASQPQPPTRLSVDGLGERWLVADKINGPVEVRKITKEFAETGEFETRLRRRVDELKALRHPCMSLVKSVEWIDNGDGLGVVATYVPGRRLSEIISHARGAAFALEFIKQVTPAIYALQQIRPGFSHGTINMDRVLVSREGRLLVLDPALGPAVESLRLSKERLRRDVGVAVPDAPDPIALDARLDIVQIGFVALSLLVGRRLNPSDFRGQIPALLDEMTSAGGPDARDLRPWLEQALQMTEHPFESALDALEALNPAARTVVAFRPAERTESTPPAHPPAAEPISVPEKPVAAVPTKAEPVIPPATSAPARAIVTVIEPARPTAPMPEVKPVSAASTPPAEPPKTSPAVAATPLDRARIEPSRRRVRIGWVHWALILMAVAASVEAAAIAGLLTSRPTTPVAPAVTIVAPLRPAPVVVSPQVSADATASTPGAPAGSTASPAVSAGVPPSPVDSGGNRPADAPTPRPAEGRVGGVKIASPLEAQVFEGGAVVGSTSGPIALSDGPHDLEIVNEAIGLRVRQRVSVKPGQLTTLNLALPQGRVNVNAVPWASVWVDGNAAGDTPIANLSLLVGSHEFVFRHPQLGEQRLVALVKADGTTRVSASFQR